MAGILVTGAHHEDRVRYTTSLAMKFLCGSNSSAEGCGQCNNCQRVLSRCHPNVTYIEPAAQPSDDSQTDATAFDNPKQEIKIADIRRVIQENHKTNYEKGPALFIVSHMHQTTKAAANALLKIIEESQENKIFLALAPSRTSVLPTIASRLLSHIVRPAAHEYDEVSTALCEKIHQITKTPPKQRFELCAQFNLGRNECLQEMQKLSTACHLLISAYFAPDHSLHQYALPPEVALKLGDAISAAHEQLLRNLNPRLVGENLLMSKWPYSKLTRADAN